MIEIIEQILFWICFFVLLWNGYFLLVNKGIPNIKTAPAIRKAMIERLKADINAKNKDTYIIYDLGSGNGDFSRDMAQAIPDATVIGIEISKLAYWRSLLMKKIKGIKNLKFINKSFHDIDLGNADAVVMFLLGTLMGEIRPKIEADVPKGTLILSNKFQIGGNWVPDAAIDVKTAYPHQKTFYIYTA